MDISANYSSQSFGSIKGNEKVENSGNAITEKIVGALVDLNL